jgi:hypothetical protein
MTWRANIRAKIAAVNPNQGKLKIRPTIIKPTAVNNSQGSDVSMGFVQKGLESDRGGIAIGKFSVFSVNAG